MVKLDERLISGKGLLRLPFTSTDYKKAKVITLYCDVVRRPVSEYANYNYNPFRSRYGTLCFMRDGYVIREEPIEFLKQSFDFYPEPAAQALYAVECAYQGILESYVNLGVALGATPVSVTNNIKDWNHVDLFWDEVKLVCYADTAILLTAESKPYDLCPEQTDKEPTPLPPPPDPDTLDVIPPGSPLGDGTNPPVSPPYDGDSDNGDTVPFPDDSDTPPPPPPSGQRLNVVILWYINDDGGNPRTSNIFVWGDATEVRSISEGGLGKLQLLCYGAAPTTGSPVSPTPIWVDVLPPDGNPNRYGNTNQPSIVSSTPI